MAKNKTNTYHLHFIYQYFLKYNLFIAIGLFVFIQLQYLDFVPIWDGGWYMDLLYGAMEKPFSLANYALSGHPAVFYALLLAFTQWIDFGNVYLIHLLQIIIGCIGIFSFYKILQFIFKKKYSVEIFLTTFIFAIHPVFLGNSLMPTLDFPVTSFLLAMMASLLYKRYGLFLLFALFSIFTRETGLSFYLSFIVAYAVVFVTRQKKLKKDDYLKLVWFLIPVVSYGIFILYKIITPVHSKALWGVETGHPLKLLTLFLQFDLTNPFTITHLLHVFVINFNWIFTLFILLYLGGKYGLKLISFILNKPLQYPNGPIDINWKVFFILLFVFIANGMVLFNYITFTNIRYRLPLIPLFLIFGLACYLILLQKHRRLRIVLLILIVPLFFIQNFFTIDKVSKDIMNTFKFGKHDILCMTEITREVHDCGRDQRTYNLQYANMVPLANKAIQKMNLDEEVNIISQFQTHFFFIRRIDKRTKEMTLQKPSNDVIEPNLYSFDRSRPHSPSLIFQDLKDSELPNHFYYLILPAWSNPHFELMRLEKRGYSAKEKHTIEYKGYSLQLLSLER